MELLQGGVHRDERGAIFFSNTLDLSPAKRMYIIENQNTGICRAWQGHKIESRWFVAVQGAFEIKIVNVDNFEDPSDDLEVQHFFLKSGSMDSLHIGKGCASSIQALEPGSKLAVFSDYHLGEVQDDYKFDSQKWKQE